MRLNLYKNHLYKLLSNNKISLVYVPLGLYWIILFTLTSIPSDSLPSIGGIDKFEHFFAYTVLAALIGLTVHFQSLFQLSSREKILASFSIAFTYGVLDELHQIPIRGRYFDWWDLFANFLGVLSGLALLSWFTAVQNSDLEYSGDGTKEED